MFRTFKDKFKNKLNFNLDALFSEFCTNK